MRFVLPLPAIGPGVRRRITEIVGAALIVGAGALLVALASFDSRDPSFNRAADGPIHNWLGASGSYTADLVLQTMGLAGVLLALILAGWGSRMVVGRAMVRPWLRLTLLPLFLAAGSAALVPVFVVFVLTVACTRVGRRKKERLGTAERRRGRDAQHQAVELAPPEQVGDWFAGAAARRPVGEHRARLRRNVALGVREHACHRKSRRLGQQQARLARLEPAADESVAHFHAASSASSASCSAWCSVRSAPISSSSSPSMMRSILCSVRLIRWSVTRPCGKL